MSDDNRETIWEYGNRIDAENAAKNQYFQREQEAYAAERARGHERASRYYAELPQPAAPAGGSALTTSLGVAFVGFLVLLWGSQFALFQVSRLFGATTLEGGLSAVGKVNGLRSPSWGLAPLWAG